MAPQEVVKPPLQISMSSDVDVAGHMQRLAAHFASQGTSRRRLETAHQDSLPSRPSLLLSEKRHVFCSAWSVLGCASTACSVCAPDREWSQRGQSDNSGNTRNGIPPSVGENT